MVQTAHMSLAEIEQRVCDVASEEFGIARERVTPRHSPVEDFGVDSLDMVEFFITLEETFSVTLPDRYANPVYKAVFTRRPFLLGDLAELVYLQQGTGTPERTWWRRAVVEAE